MFVVVRETVNEVVYLCERDFRGSCVTYSMMMNENTTNRDRSRHVDVKVHCRRDLVCDGKLVKCAGSQNVSDYLTKTLSRPAYEKHTTLLWGTRYSCPLSTSRLSLGPSRLR